MAARKPMAAVTNSATTNSLNSAVEDPLAAVQQGLTWLQKNEANLVNAAIVLVGGVLIAVWLGRIARRGMERRNLDPPVRNLLVRLIRSLTVAIALYIALDQLNFKLTGLLAFVGTVGVGIGLGLQTLASNTVAGVTIIFTRPFRVGEYIEILGVNGVVSQINLLSTTLVHSDTSRIIIPNNKVSGEVVHTFGFIRQADLSVTLPYKTDLKAAQDLIMRVVESNPRVLRDPAPVIGVAALQDFGVLIKVNPWVKLADFGSVPGQLYEAIVKALRENQIEIPRPQHELHVVPGGAAQPSQAA